MSAGHSEAKPFQPILTPQGRELFPQYVPPHIETLKPERREVLFGHEDAIMRIDNPVVLGIPHSGSGHHPEQSRSERLKSINTPLIDSPRQVGLREEDVLDTLGEADEKRAEAARSLERYNPKSFLALRRWVVQRSLDTRKEEISGRFEDYLTAVQLATAVQYGQNEATSTAAGAVKRALLDPGEGYKKGKDEHQIKQIESIKNGSFGELISQAPHLRNSWKDKRLIEKMRIRRHGRIDHGNGSMAADFGAENFEHTVHALSGSDQEVWDANASGHDKIHASHSPSDRSDVARSIRKYERFEKRAKGNYDSLTFKDRGIRKGVVGEVTHRARKVHKGAGEIGRLETKQILLDEAIQQKAEQKEAKRQEKAERREQRKIRREETPTAPTALNPIETTATEVIPIAPVSPEPHFEPATPKTESERLGSMNGSLKIKVGGEVFEDAIIVTSGTAKSAKTGEDVRAYVVRYTDAAGVEQTKKVSEARLSAWNAVESDD